MAKHIPYCVQVEQVYHYSLLVLLRWNSLQFYQTVTGRRSCR